MTLCFQLFPNGADEATPLVAVDEAICAHLDVPCDSEQWRNGWVESIGFSLALGKSWDEIDASIAEYGEDRWAIELRKIVAFLRANYTPKSGGR